MNNVLRNTIWLGIFWLLCYVHKLYKIKGEQQDVASSCKTSLLIVPRGNRFKWIVLFPAMARFTITLITMEKALPCSQNVNSHLGKSLKGKVGDLVPCYMFILHSFAHSRVAVLPAHVPHMGWQQRMRACVWKANIGHETPETDSYHHLKHNLFQRYSFSKKPSWCE